MFRALSWGMRSPCPRGGDPSSPRQRLTRSFPHNPRWTALGRGKVRSSFWPLAQIRAPVALFLGPQAVPWAYVVAGGDSGCPAPSQRGLQFKTRPLQASPPTGRHPSEHVGSGQSRDRAVPRVPPAHRTWLPREPHRPLLGSRSPRSEHVVFVPLPWVRSPSTGFSVRGLKAGFLSPTRASQRPVGAGAS